MRQPKILTTIRDYSWSLFRQDALAGLTVALVALPLSIAIAIASGATPAQGLITAIIGGFVISLTSGSRVQIGGPTGAFIVVVYSVIADHGYDGLVLATLMAGAILLVAGYLRAGRLIALVPEPVINGFTVGIAIIIATSQLKDFLGLEIAKLPAEFLPKLAALAGALPHSSPYAVGVALLALLLMVVLRRRAPRSPSLVIGVAAGSAFAAFAALPVDTIASRFGELPAGLPSPTLPSISLAKVQELLPSALVIAFLAGVESLLSAIVADRMIEGQHRPNAEIMAPAGAATRIMRARMARIAPAISSDVSSRSVMSISMALMSPSDISPSSICPNRASDSSTLSMKCIQILCVFAALRESILWRAKPPSRERKDYSHPLLRRHSGYRHEIRQHRMAMFGGDAFRVELHAVDGQFPVPESHDMAVVAGRVDDQLFGNIFNDQRVIACCGEGGGEAREQPAAIMADGAGLAMHQAAAHHLATEILADGLMAEANAEQRLFRLRTGSDHIEADTGFVGRARAG